MGVPFTCDFCPGGIVDLLEGKGKQEMVYPFKAVMKGKENDLAPRFKYRCDVCISAKINTTPDGLAIMHSDPLIRWKEKADEKAS